MVNDPKRFFFLFFLFFFFVCGGGGELRRALVGIQTAAMRLFPLESVPEQSGDLGGWNRCAEGPEAYLQITSFMRVGGRISHSSHLSGPNPATWVRDRRRGGQD